jgi:hypothetical protein
VSELDDSEDESFDPTRKSKHLDHESDDDDDDFDDDLSKSRSKSKNRSRSRPVTPKAAVSEPFSSLICITEHKKWLWTMH